MQYLIAMRSAFSRGDIGGNPAGILISEQLPNAQTMLSIADKVGAAETVFAAPLDTSHSHWKVRYYSPEQEVPFCGHATIALAAQLHAQFGNAEFTFSIAQQDISVAMENGNFAIITTPKPRFEYLEPKSQDTVMHMFKLQDKHLIEPVIGLVNAGSNHLAIELNSRKALSQMDYNFEAARTFMQQRSIATVALYYRATPLEIHIRNAFAFGGLFEDPATGSGAAAVSGYLYGTDTQYQPDQVLTFYQGDDMGQPCTLITRLPDSPEKALLLIGESRELKSKCIEV